jgi:hypothetical protein
MDDRLPRPPIILRRRALVGCAGDGYAIIDIYSKGRIAMEAERLNQIAGTLADLRTRAAELRRYL